MFIVRCIWTEDTRGSALDARAAETMVVPFAPNLMVGTIFETRSFACWSLAGWAMMLAFVLGSCVTWLPGAACAYACANFWICWPSDGDSCLFAAGEATWMKSRLALSRNSVAAPLYGFSCLS